MKKYEYRVLNLRNEIELIRKSENPRKSEGDEILAIEILNIYGAKGWRALYLQNALEIYLEREIA